jgi:thiol-disulfide isomerase/thioredoxin
MRYIERTPMLSFLISLLLRGAAMLLAGYLGFRLLKKSSRQPTLAAAAGLLLAGWLPWTDAQSAQISTNDQPVMARIEGQTLAGAPFNLQQLKGKIVLIDFWATWCPPCVSSIPDLKDLYQKYQAHGFEIVGVSLNRDALTLKNFVEAQQLGWTQLIPPENPNETGFMNPIALRYAVNAIPHTMLVDREGNIIARGLRGASIEAAVAKALGQPVALWTRIGDFAWTLFFLFERGLVQSPLWLMMLCVFGCSLISARLKR